MRPIGSFLLRSREEVVVQDAETYKRVTVRFGGQGVVLRDQAAGRDIGTKRQFRLRGGQFVMSRIDARHGAMGIAPAELDGAILTNDFPAYTLDPTLILPRFFELVTGTAAFVRYCRNCSTGTTNRQRLNEELFLEVAVPLPPLDEQARLVAAYDQQAQQTARKRAEAEGIRKEADNFFLQELGLETPGTKKRKVGWQFMESQFLSERWDYFAASGSALTGLPNAYYPLRTLGSVYNFVSRPWNNRQAQQSTFRYVDIAAVEPDMGITEAKKLEVANAPSRASQTIEKGDLLIAMTRPYLKKFALVAAEFSGCVCSSGFAVVAASMDYDLPFLREFLFCPYGVGQIRDKMTGALYLAITDAALKSIRVPLPPTVAEQQRIVTTTENKREQARHLESKALATETAARQAFEASIFA